METLAYLKPSVPHLFGTRDSVHGRRGGGRGRRPSSGEFCPTLDPNRLRLVLVHSWDVEDLWEGFTEIC